MADTLTAEEALSALIPTLAQDLLMALRFFYYVRARGLVPDVRYDEIEKEYLSREDTDQFSNPLNEPGSDKLEDYPHNIRALALYLALTLHHVHAPKSEPNPKP